MSGQREIYVLFLCVGNSCRSQMAEALLRRWGGGRFDAYSAGAEPAGFVHGLAIEAMKTFGIDISDNESKGLDDVADMPFDVVITLCDPLAPDKCPAWRGAPVAAHWPLPDPAFHPGTPEERLGIAMTVARRLEGKIKAMVELDFSQDKARLQQQLAHLGEI
jgi:arsenate reductase